MGTANWEGGRVTLRGLRRAAAANLRLRRKHTCNLSDLTAADRARKERMAPWMININIDIVDKRIVFPSALQQARQRAANTLANPPVSLQRPACSGRYLYQYRNEALKAGYQLKKKKKTLYFLSCCGERGRVLWIQIYRCPVQVSLISKAVQKEPPSLFDNGVEFELRNCLNAGVMKAVFSSLPSGGMIQFFRS
ncbi:uncharacterized protein V6R79_010641 [Siganus canaliculatus]